MTNLLRADFRRLFKNRAFYICTALLFVAGVALPLIHYFTMRDYPNGLYFGIYFTEYALIAVIALAAFSALFIGADYSDGTIRNKLVAGSRRSSVYLSNFAVQVVTGLILCIVYLVPYVIIGTTFLGDFPDNGVRLILVSLATTVSFASIFTLIAMLSSSKARSAVICLVCAIALIAAGLIVSNGLAEPEFYSTYSLDADGNVLETYDDPNPGYISGTKRTVLMAVNDLNPGAQAMRVFTKDGFSNIPEVGKTDALCDLAIIVLTTGAGILIFKKKDLK